MVGPQQVFKTDENLSKANSNLVDYTVTSDIISKNPPKIVYGSVPDYLPAVQMSNRGVVWLL